MYKSIDLGSCHRSLSTIDNYNLNHSNEELKDKAIFTNIRQSILIKFQNKARIRHKIEEIINEKENSSHCFNKQIIKFQKRMEIVK